MAKASPIQSAFNVGEVTPLVYGRVDQDWYPAALAECLNYLPLIQGPITRRAGTGFIAPVKDSSAATAIRRFEFSTTQAYGLEFGNQYLRFVRDRAQITLTAQAVTNITQANPAALTYSGSDTYANGDRVVVTGVLGMTQVNNREFVVANVNVGLKTFQLSGVNSTGYGAYVSGGNVAEIYEISTPYVTADIPLLKFTQSTDTLYIFHPDYAQRKLTRSGHTSWTLTEIDFLDGPYLPTNEGATTLALSALTGSVTVTASASLFVSTDVDRLIRWKDPAGNWTWLKVTAFGSATSVTALIRGADASAGTATVNWRLGTWSATTGYPSCGTFFEDRLVMGGVPDFSARLDGSRSGDYEDFAPSDPAGTVTDSHAISFTLNARAVNAMRWLLDDEKGLLSGTAGGEWLVRPSTLTSALTPTNVSARRSSTRGSADIQALRVGEVAMFVQSAGRKLREITYEYQKDGLVSPDRTVRAEHITRSGIKELDYQQEPESVVWAVRNDGVLLSLTYDRDQKVLAWARHVLGGAFSTGAAVVEAVCVIPSPDGGRDDLMLVVKRTINGATARHIEYLTETFEDGDAIEDAFFVDSGLTYSGVPNDVISGLNHLEGETVSILADGAVVPDAEVVGGSITLPYEASTVHIGLGYTSRAKALRPEAGAADGTAQGKIKRLSRVIFRFLASVGLDVGPTEDMLSPITFRTSADNTNEAVPPFSGDIKVDWEGDYDREGPIVWQQSQPLPSTITALMPQLVTEDDG